MPPPEARPQVILYSRPGCHLCDEAEALLRALESRLGFITAVINIEDDDDLHRRFMLEIPVIEAAGRVVASAPIRPGALEEDLAEALSSAN